MFTLHLQCETFVSPFWQWLITQTLSLSLWRHWFCHTPSCCSYSSSPLQHWQTSLCHRCTSAGKSPQTPGLKTGVKFKEQRDFSGSEGLEGNGRPCPAAGKWIVPSMRSCACNCVLFFGAHTTQSRFLSYCPSTLLRQYLLIMLFQHVITQLLFWLVQIYTLTPNNRVIDIVNRKTLQAKSQ